MWKRDIMFNRLLFCSHIFVLEIEIQHNWIGVIGLSSNLLNAILTKYYCNDGIWAYRYGSERLTHFQVEIVFFLIIV